MGLVTSDTGQPARSARGTLGLLAVATAIGSMGLAAGGTAGALLARELTGSAAAAGLPLGVLVAGSAVGALIISSLTGRRGRGPGLLLGYGVGTAGALAVIGGALAGSFALVLAGSAALGGANAGVLLTRYAAADLGGPTARGRALGTVLFANSLGAVAGPNLLDASGTLAAAAGLPRLTGLYLVAVPSFVLAGLLLAALTRRHATVLGRGTIASEQARGQVVREVAAALRAPAAGVALAVLAIANLVMVAIMAIVPVHLTAHGHGLGLVGLVISIHILGMFAPSPLSGWAADRLGAVAVTATGAALLLAAGLAGALVDQASGSAIMIVLGLLGVGWNAGVVGASTMLAASAPPALRPRMEGVGEFAMGVAAAAGAPAAGLVIAVGGFTALCALGAAAAALALTTVGWSSRSRRRPTTTRQP